MSLDIWFNGQTPSFSGKVALVGSSGSLFKSGLGSKIDSFDTVLRFNRAPTIGFEADVGGKTSFRVANNHVFANVEIVDKRYTCQPRYFIRDLRNTSIIYAGPGVPDPKHVHSSVQVFAVDFKKLAKLKSVLKYADKANPSVGTMLIGICVASGIKPTLFGFDLDINNTTQRSHYWEDRPGISGLHKIGYEKAFIKRMIAESKVMI